MNRLLLKSENKRHQEKVKREIIVGVDLIHIVDGGKFKKYSQNPPYPPFLYGCSLCGEYFEANK